MINALAERLGAKFKYETAVKSPALSVIRESVVPVPQFNQADGIFDVVAYMDKLLGKYDRRYHLGNPVIFTRRGADFVKRGLTIDFAVDAEVIFLRNVAGVLHGFADPIRGGIVRDESLRQRIDKFAHWLTIVK